MKKNFLHLIKKKKYFEKLKFPPIDLDIKCEGHCALFQISKLIKLINAYTNDLDRFYQGHLVKFENFQKNLIFLSNEENFSSQFFNQRLNVISFK